MPIYEDGTAEAIFLADGTDLKAGTNVIQDYEYRNIPELQKKVSINKTGEICEYCS